MVSAQSFFPALSVFFALLCVPPLLGFLAQSRRLTYLRDRDRPLGLTQALRLACAAVLVLNTLILIRTAVDLAGGTSVLHWWHAGGLVLAWVCLWIWIAASIQRRRRRRTAF